MSHPGPEPSPPDVLEQSRQRTRQAHEILTRLRLFERWGAFGTPVLVGAVAYELTMAPDIDVEIYCDTPRIQDGFAVLRDCAVLDNVRKARFGNYLDDPDEGLYWRLDYRAADGIDWKIDMWMLRRDHPGPCAEQLVAPLRAALTPERRRTILELKSLIQTGAIPHQPSMISIARSSTEGSDPARTSRRGWKRTLVTTSPAGNPASYRPGESVGGLWQGGFPNVREVRGGR